MPPRNDSARASQAFTLVELILVMALLTTLLALSAPTILRSFKGRDLDQDATLLFAVTEYARSEAVSQGVPMSVWIDPGTGSFGVHASDGYAGDARREKTCALSTGVRFDAVEAETDQSGRPVLATFEPEGTLDPESSIAALRLLKGDAAAISLEQTGDGWGYEIVKEAP